MPRRCAVICWRLPKRTFDDVSLPRQRNAEPAEERREEGKEHAGPGEGKSHRRIESGVACHETKRSSRASGLSNRLLHVPHPPREPSPCHGTLYRTTAIFRVSIVPSVRRRQKYTPADTTWPRRFRPSHVTRYHPGGSCLFTRVRTCCPKASKISILTWESRGIPKGINVDGLNGFGKFWGSS